jgi:hypothetical protein
VRSILLVALLALTVQSTGRALAAPLPQACTTEAKRHCASSPAGARLDRCMQQHESVLSRDCKEALTIRVAQQQPPCQADFEKLCKGVQPGGGRVQACLRQHEAELSKSCKASLAAAQSRVDPCQADVDRLCKGVQPGAGRIAACMQQNAAKVSNACKAEIVALERQQQQIQQQAGVCAADAAKLCPGIPTGQGRVLACLKQHAAELSASCRAAAVGR